MEGSPDNFAHPYNIEENRVTIPYWPTRPRPNRWSLFSQIVSVRPSENQKKRYNANVKAR